MDHPPSTSPDACSGREACLGRQIYILFHLLMRECDTHALAIGLTTSKWLLLCAVASEEGDPTIGQLSDRSMLSVQAVSKMVALMESQGLLTRHSRPGMGRSVYVRLTPQGRAALARTDALATEIDSRLLAGLTQHDTDRIAQDLQRLIDNLAPAPSAQKSEPLPCETSA